MLETIKNNNKLVLLIDDDKVTHLLLQELFFNKEKLLCADCGKMGIEILKKHSYKIGLIFLDLFLPNECCFKIYHIIKQNHPNIPVIAITAAYISEFKHICISEGFIDIIPKPINFQEIRNTVDRYID